MDKEQLAKMIAEKIDAAMQAGDHPKKFFITANGRGVTDGGELYNAVLADAISVMKVALIDIFQELSAAAAAQTPAPKAAASAPSKAQEKLTKSSSRK